MRIAAILVLTLFVTLTAFALPTFNPQLVLKNDHGEVSNNAILAGSNFIGSKISANTIPSNLTGSSAYPAANTYAAVSAKLTPAMLLTGYAAGVGTVSGTDTVLQAIQKIAPVTNGTFALVTETVSAAGALSTTIAESLITNASTTFAVTLAAPSGQDGQIKVIKAVTAMTGTITLAMTNISTPGFLVPTTGVSGTTTLTFTNVGDCAILIAVGGKWQIIGGSAVAS